MFLFQAAFPELAVGGMKERRLEFLGTFLHLQTNGGPSMGALWPMGPIVRVLWAYAPYRGGGGALTQETILEKLACLQGVKTVNLGCSPLYEQISMGI